MSTITKKRTYPHTPNYITLLPPGEILLEKLSEMEMSTEGLAERSGLPVEVIRRLLNAEIAVTPEIAERLEKATRIPVRNWLRHEEIYRKNSEYSKQHPEIPVY